MWEEKRGIADRGHQGHDILHNAKVGADPIRDCSNHTFMRPDHSYGLPSCVLATCTINVPAWPEYITSTFHTMPQQKVV